MLIVEIDPVDAEPRQRLVGNALDVLGSPVDAADAVTETKPKLRGDNDTRSPAA